MKSKLLSILFFSFFLNCNLSNSVTGNGYSGSGILTWFFIWGTISNSKNYSDSSSSFPASRKSIGLLHKNSCYLYLFPF